MFASSSAGSSQPESALRSNAAARPANASRVLGDAADRAAQGRDREGPLARRRRDQLDQLVERLAAGRRSRCGPLMNDRLPQANARSWAVWTSRYGALPIVVVTGSGPTRSPAVSRSTSSAAPLWFQATKTIGLPDQVVRVVRRPVPARSMPKISDTVSGARGRVVAEDVPDVLDPGRRVDQDAAMEVAARTGWSRNSNAVAIPKFQPAPRRPQKSSGSSVSLARTRRPSAVTSSTARRLSIVRPKCRWQPARRRRRASARRRRCGRRRRPGRRGRAPARRRRARRGARRRSPGRCAVAGSTVDAAHRGHVDDEAAVDARVARGAVAAGPDGDLQVVLAPEAMAVATSPASRGRTMTAGRRSWTAFHSRRASSYVADAGVMTSPPTVRRS